MIRRVEFFAVIRDASRGPYSPPKPKFDRARSTKPALDRGEVAVKVVLNLDDTLFATFIPTVEAEITSETIIAPEIELPPFEAATGLDDLSREE